MTSDEAAAMVDWLKTQKLDSPAQLEVIDRLLQARRHQITLAQLFGMSNEEAAAFREVVKQAGGDYERLVSLATSDLLTPTERKTVEKATSVVTDLRRLTEQLPMDVQTRVSVYGRAGAAMTRQLERDAIMAGQWARDCRIPRWPWTAAGPGGKSWSGFRRRGGAGEAAGLPRRKMLQHPALHRRRHVAVGRHGSDDEAAAVGACCGIERRYFG